MSTETLELVEEKNIEPKKPRKDLGITKTERKRVVIVGGGFAGLHMIKELDKSNYQVVLLDKRNHHTFQPLLYQVATSGLEAESVAYPLRKLLANHPDYHFRMVNVERIDPGKKEVFTDSGSINYDYLVIATGAKSNYFGMDSVAEHALPMKSVAEAMVIRNEVLKNYEKAMLTTDPEEREKCTNIVVAGGGPTGVEMAGALAEFKKYIMPKDYPDLDPGLAKIYLIELLPELLPPMSDNASKKSEAYLKKMGVEIVTDTQIKGFDGEVVETDKGGFPAKMLIWTGGVSGAFIPGLGDDLVNKKGRIPADGFGRVKGFENIYVVGDVAQIETEETPKGHPQLASVAVQQGEFLAKHFNRLDNGKELKPFKYSDKGTMATIGRKKAVADLSNGWKVSGAFAWFMWLGVHVFSLVGFKNKLVTLTNWFINYTSRDQESRLII